MVWNYQLPPVELLQHRGPQGNLANSHVIMRDVLESDAWRHTKAQLPLPLGVDVKGQPIIVDLAETPHLLIAGTTGSGKSVFIHTLILSLLYRFSPDQLRFVMFDSVVVELQQYNALPHLIAPVVTDYSTKSRLTLAWLVNELHHRFKLFAALGVRSLASFNHRQAHSPSSDPTIPPRLSYIVVFAEQSDGLLDGTLESGQTSLAYLACTGRAAGIHLVLTTQKMSHSRVSEILQSSIPARIAFQCTSRTESLAILGVEGADKLLGHGGLLFRPPGSTKLIRAQVPLATDQELQGVVDFIARQVPPSDRAEVSRTQSQPVSGSGASDAASVEDEDLIHECIEIIRSEQRATISLLQRRLRLTYTRAARIMDELEQRGIVGPSKGAEPREILFDVHEPAETAPVESEQNSEPHFVVHHCDICNGKIEFDANELGDRTSVSVPCPFCGVVIEISLPA